MVSDIFEFFPKIEISHLGDPEKFNKNQIGKNRAARLASFWTISDFRLPCIRYLVGGGETDQKMVRWVPKWTKQLKNVIFIGFPEGPPGGPKKTQKEPEFLQNHENPSGFHAFCKSCENVIFCFGGAGWAQKVTKT